MSIFDRYQARYESARQEVLGLDEYLALCKADPDAYAGPAERLLKAIGEPEVLDSRSDPRLSRIFQNKILRRYPAFAEFYGMEESIEHLVSYLKHAAQGLEEKKQILYLLGPVGGGKSSLAEKLKELMQVVPFYAIEGSPVFESPLGLFSPEEDGPILEEDYGIPRRFLRTTMSPWAVKRLQEFNGDITKFRVVKLYPSILEQVAIAKTEPGDENNQDISSLVGKVDIRQLERFAQHDADAYSFSGALCRANQGLMEFVEMFKAPIKVLHPLLTATQEGNYNGTEGLSALPFQGIILAHSNESEWQTFRNNKNNEAFLDRVFIVKVPYCLRVTEETHIYEKLLRSSSLAESPCAPGTLKMMAQFSVLTRLKEPENSNIFSKMRVYDGENLKDTDPKAKSIQEYRDYAGVDEGMSGISTRFAFKILSQVFNFDHSEVAANPVHLLYVLERQIAREQLPTEVQDRYLGFLKQYLAPRYAEFIGKELQTAYLEFLRRVRPECLRSLRHLRRLLDPGQRVPRSGHRRDDGSRRPQRRVGEDREAGGYLQPQGLSKRDRQLRPAGPRQQRRREPALDQLREVAGGDREEDVLQHRRVAAGDLLQRQGVRRRPEEARPVRRPYGGQGVHGQAGAPALRVVPAGA